MSAHPPYPESSPRDPELFRVNPMSYLAVAILALAVLGPVGYAPAWGWVLLALPILFAWWVARTRTRVDERGVHARSMLSTTSVPWSKVAGVLFPRTGFAQLETTGGDHVRLGGVSFHDLPRLAAASGGRIPDPYAA